MRAQFHDFSKGLWTVGGKEHTMQGYVRRSRGMHAIRTPSLRSRDGSTLLHALSAHSLSRFNDVRFQGSSTALYRAGVSILTGLSGDRLAFVSYPPQSGLFDSLFVAGGGLLKKIDTGGGVTKWGIAKPGTAPVLSKFVVSRGDPITLDDVVNVRLSRANGYRVFDVVGVSEFVSITGPTIPTPAAVGAGLGAGTYKYKITFLNSNTNSRSNAQDDDVSITVSAGQLVTLSSVPISGDSQVDRREIYRTTANGTAYFLLDTITDNTSTTFVDSHPDADLDTFALQFDNDPPENSYGDAWVHKGTGIMWWTRDSTNGSQARAYYSPPNRPESVLGFIEVANPDDPCQKGFSWSEQNWVFTEAHLFRIDGSEEPFIPREVAGVPGTTKPFTVVTTPFGVLCQAFDGIRLFDGSTSRLMGFKTLGPLFRNESMENLTAFSGIVATYSNEEYIISDGEQTLALNLRTETWRDLGVGCSALYREIDTAICQASFSSNVYALEDYGASALNDGGTAITLEWEVGGNLSDISQQGTLQRIYLDINTNSQTLTPQLIIDGTTVTYPTFSNSARAMVEFSVNKTARLFSIRLTGSVSAKVELFGVEADVYIPRKAA